MVQSSMANFNLTNETGSKLQTLGDPIRVDFRDIAEITEFYIKSVVASNDAKPG